MVSSGSRILNADPRGKLALGLLAGALVWKLSVPALLVLAACCLWAVRGLPSASGSRPQGGPQATLRTYAFFVFFWTLFKWGMDVLSGMDAVEALWPALVLGGRLSVLLLVGLALAMSMSVRQMTMAVTWAARPVLRNRAWQAGLALSLLVHFLPMTWRAVAEVRQTVRLRVPDLPFRRRLTVVPVAVMRALAQKTWNQSLAIVARGMDRPEAWAVDMRPHAGEVLCFLGLGLCLGGLAVL